MIFSGYKSIYPFFIAIVRVLTAIVPHPLFAKAELRVQTDGVKSPKEAVKDVAKGLISDLAQFSREFTKEYELRKMVTGDGSSTNAAEK